MSNRIDSRKNERYKAWYAISRLNRGKKTNRVLLEGLRLCSDAVQSGIAAEAVLTADSVTPQVAGFVSSLPASIERWTMTDSLFQALCDTEHPQGLAMVCLSPVLQKPAGQPSIDDLYLVADGISDPGNLGTMIRTADAFAFNGVLVTTGTVWPMNPKVIRAAMGSCFHIPIISFQDITDVAGWLAMAGIPLIAADPHGEKSVAALVPGGAALVIGNEAHGLSELARKLAKETVYIYMPGRSESLNAAAATAILAYELMKKRHNRSVTGI
ncbi:MAG: RNA methyltransferase [Bacillota bacterium]|nr:RNA methyltransferase [Bacillota bacterium]